MATPQDLPRQVNQSTNDIKSLYELQAKTHRRVKRIDRQHGRLLGQHGRLLGQHSHLLGQHGHLMDRIARRLDTMEETYGRKLDEILGILKAP